MRSEAHFWSTMNYIHHNPVRHHYVKSWLEWPFSSAHAFLESVGRKEAAALWQMYPVGNYGAGWDEPEL
jgi:putative transposase